MSLTINKRQPFHYSRGGSTPFHPQGYRPHTGQQNHHNQKLHHRGGHLLHRGNHLPPRARHNLIPTPLTRTAPKNHSWEEEAANLCHDYESIATVIWVDGIYGEVICEKNLRQSLAHFYFDGGTEIDGQTVASAARSEDGLGLAPGTKIEFSCKYSPTDEKEPHLVRILKMSIYTAAPKKELEQLCMSSYSSEPHKPRLAVDSSGDFVLISPILFSKDWALQCIQSTTIGCVPEYQEPDKGKFIAGRTFLGTVIRSPRWMSDGGEKGDPGTNVRKMLLGIDHMNPLIDGQATILHVVPFQSALLEADDRPGEIMYFPIVSFPLAFKQQIVQGNRVHFAACKNLDTFNYPWRVIEIAFLKYDSPYHYKMAASRPMYRVDHASRHVKIEEATLIGVDSTETAIETGVTTSHEEKKKDIWEDIFGVSEGTQLCQNDLEEFLVEKPVAGPAAPTPPVDTPPPSSPSNPAVSISLDSVAQAESAPTSDEPKYMIFLEPSSDPTIIREVLGYDSDDTEPPVRSLGRLNRKRDYNHLVMTIPERLAEEQRKREEERREAELAARMELREEREMRLKLQERFAQIRGEKPIENIRNVEERAAKIEKKAITTVVQYEEPVEGMRIIGLYDDVRWIFELSLIKNEENKRREEARQEAEKLRKQKGEDAAPEPVEQSNRPKDGFWYRRRGPRPLPAICVAELLSNRTEEEICQEYETRNISRTVVLRNPRTQPSEEASQVESPEVELVEEDVTTAREIEEERREETKENIDEKKEEEEAKPVSYKSNLLNDQIIAKFIQPLLKKQPP